MLLNFSVSESLSAGKKRRFFGFFMVTSLYLRVVICTLMDIIYHIADFQKNILIVLTAFPLELKNK